MLWLTIDQLCRLFALHGAALRVGCNLFDPACEHVASEGEIYTAELIVRMLGLGFDRFPIRRR